MPVVTHLVSLEQAAGVEAHFSEFVRQARVNDPSFSHGWLNAAGEMHPFIASRTAPALAHSIRAKRRFGTPRALGRSSMRWLQVLPEKNARLRPFATAAFRLSYISMV